MLSYFNASPSIIRVIKSRRLKWTGYVAATGEVRYAYNLVGKTKGETPFGRPRGRGEDNIRMDLREMGWKSVDWMQVAQDRDQWRALVTTVMNLRVP
jgi:hypothetical protein